jgi:hypothetical protein
MPPSWFLLIFLLHQPIPDQPGADSWVAAFPQEFANQAACNNAAQDQATALQLFASTKIRQKYKDAKIGAKMATVCVQGFSFTDTGP